MNRKPRVLYVTPSMTMGGAERHLTQLLQHLAPHVDQHLALIYPVTQDPFFYQKWVEDSGVPVTFFNKRPGKLGRPMLALRYLRLLLSFRPDIVYAQLWHAMDIVRAFHQLIRWPRPIIVVNSQLRLIEPLYIAAERRFIGQTDHIVALGEEIAEEYRSEVPGSAGRITVIGNAVDTKDFSPGDRAEARARLPIDVPLETTLLLYVGRLTARKNLDTLIRAVSLLHQAGRWPDDALLLIVGRAVLPDYAAQLHQMAEGLTEQIKFLKETSDVGTFYQACDAHVLVSHYEGHPLVVLEAGFSSVPSLISDDANRVPVVKDGQTGWVTSADNAQVMADSLTQILATPRAERDRMGAAAREHLVAEYRAEVMAERYLALYNRLIASRKR